MLLDLYVTEPGPLCHWTFMSLNLDLYVTEPLCH